MLRSPWRRAAATDLNARRTTSRARVLVPLGFGAWSLLLGIDANWDLYNYHLYNPFAFLNGKLDIDLAAAGLQSYFNPLLDIPYYVMVRSLPAPVVVFVMGAVHGLNFVLLLAIVRKVVAGLPAEDENRVPLLLALAGVLTANFLSGLGNTMGDNATALFCLGSLLLVLSSREKVADSSGGSVPLLAAAGLVMGLGVGLKLTNAVFAVALCAALLFAPASVAGRVRAGLVFGMGVLLGFAVTAGFWHYEMWARFGNPFFPQFSAVFPNPLSRDVMAADSQWLPRNLAEALLWPFLSALDSHRVGQASFRQAIWPLAYGVFIAWLLARLVRREDRSGGGVLRGHGLLVVAFVAIAYVVWMMLFSISRYLVPAELLAPLFVFVLLASLVEYRQARRAATWLLGLSTALVVAGGFETWGHKGLRLAAYEADVPALSRASTTTALIPGGDPAWAWLATFFPPEVAFIQLGGNFPEGPRFGAKVHEMVALRGGPTFAILQGARHHRLENVAQANDHARRLGISTSETGCRMVRRAVESLRLRARYREGAGAAGSLCELGLRPEDERDLEAENAAERNKAAAILASYGFALQASACASHRARVGQGVVVYQWCRVAAESALSGTTAR